MFLYEIWKNLSESLPFSFIFVDGEDNEINNGKESTTKLSHILDGKNLYIKKEIKSRKILGSIINSEGKLKY